MYVLISVNKFIELLMHGRTAVVTEGSAANCKPCLMELMF